MQFAKLSALIAVAVCSAGALAKHWGNLGHTQRHCHPNRNLSLEEVLVRLGSAEGEKFCKTFLEKGEDEDVELTSTETVFDTTVTVSQTATTSDTTAEEVTTTVLEGLSTVVEEVQASVTVTTHPDPFIETVTSTVVDTTAITETPSPITVSVPNYDLTMTLKKRHARVRRPENVKGVKRATLFQACKVLLTKETVFPSPIPTVTITTAETVLVVVETTGVMETDLRTTTVTSPSSTIIDFTTVTSTITETGAASTITNTDYVTTITTTTVIAPVSTNEVPYSVCQPGIESAITPYDEIRFDGAGTVVERETRSFTECCKFCWGTEGCFFYEMDRNSMNMCKLRLHGGDANIKADKAIQSCPNGSLHIFSLSWRNKNQMGNFGPCATGREWLQSFGYFNGLL